MSLVNLAHVCSHLQNASLARLGLTPIPYTKLHLSVALLLHRQGFLSQVKLGGLSPPASCFGNGPSDNNRVSAHLLPSAVRNAHSPEAALEFKIRTRATKEALEQHGFPPDAVEFAEKESMMTYDHFVAAGWATEAAKKVLDLRKDIRRLHKRIIQTKPVDQRLLAGLSEEEEVVRLRELLDEIKAQATEDFISTLTPNQRALLSETSHIPVEEEYDAAILEHRFSFSALQAFAGPAAVRSAIHVERVGVTVDAMGLEFPNQPITLPNPKYADADGLDSEGVVTQANRASRRLWLGLKYYDSMPVLSKLKLISKPTKRIWLSHADFGRVVRGQEAGEVKGLRQIGEIMVVSTDRGIMEARECVDRRIGGQPLMRVW